MISAIAALQILLSAPTPAALADRGLTAINAALDAVVPPGAQACSSATLLHLRSARDCLEAVHTRSDPVLFERARSEVENAIDAAEGACESDARAALGGAVELLDSIAHEVTRVASGSTAVAAGPGVSATAAGQGAVFPASWCWNYRDDGLDVDPGCFVKRDGRAPMNKERFAALLDAVRREGEISRRKARMGAALAAGSRSYLTAQQLAELIKLLPGDVHRVEMVKRFAGRVVDPYNAESVAVLIRGDMGRRAAVAALRLSVHH